MPDADPQRHWSPAALASFLEARGYACSPDRMRESVFAFWVDFLEQTSRSPLHRLETANGYHTGALSTCVPQFICQSIESWYDVHEVSQGDDVQIAMPDHLLLSGLIYHYARKGGPGLLSVHIDEPYVSSDPTTLFSSDELNRSFDDAVGQCPFGSLLWVHGASQLVAGLAFMVPAQTAVSILGLLNHDEQGLTVGIDIPHAPSPALQVEENLLVLGTCLLDEDGYPTLGGTTLPLGDDWGTVGEVIQGFTASMDCDAPHGMGHLLVPGFNLGIKAAVIGAHRKGRTEGG